MTARRVKINTPGLEEYIFNVINMPGDGNCFFHAVCYALYPAYLNESVGGVHTSRLDIVRRLRKEMSRLLGSVNSDDGRSYYDSIGNGSLAEMGKNDPEYSLENIKNILDGDGPIDDPIPTYFGMILKKTIYIFNAKTKDLYGYPGLPDVNLDVIMLWYNGSHYDLLTVSDRSGALQSHLSSEHPVSRAIYQRLSNQKAVE